ncbi:MAG: Signal transduction histidine kinase [Candidatus Beckwithbacteria bacterium GW2011_GWA2_43_10]|uniref:histidine kinase n=1 Tax=Candidatus Beckwithbacteria bacterium GW2011_GWA2_43_10 TaxID=1618369 RepID=A0A0G1BZY2_9BACT|nr:MAG: Signal transduction histidine kinase [Candidatus Beckwithbacteria bacterium GW2011_GWA2_43_10]
MNEFSKARLTLFGWYLVISFFLLSAFTLVAFQAERQAFARIEKMLSNKVDRPVLSALLERRLREFSGNFKERLLYFDIVLFFVAAGASWFLSGKTLEPIEAMVKKQEEFSADASHELRTPLTSIIMEVETIKRTEKQIPKEINKSLDNISQESLRMKNLINNLLVLVRNRTADVGVFKTFSLNEAAKKAFKSLEKSAAEKQLEYTYYEKNTGLKMKGDQEAVERMFVIILDNAIKFTPAGSIKARLYKEGKSAKIEIADTGIGIPAKDLPYIFERFFRAQTKTRLQGSGLGLAIAKKTAIEHKGKIAVKSKLNEGSVFTVTFPISS